MWLLRKNCVTAAGNGHCDLKDFKVVKDFKKEISRKKILRRTMRRRGTLHSDKQGYATFSATPFFDFSTTIVSPSHSPPSIIMFDSGSSTCSAITRLSDRAP